MTRWKKFEQGHFLPWVAALLFLVMIITLIPMGLIDSRLKQAPGQHGIISFEFIFHRDRATTIMERWGEELVDQARMNIRLDFFFLLEYSLLMAALSLLFTRKSTDRIRQWGRRFAVIALAAGLFDAGENILLLQVLASVKTVPAWKIPFASVLACLKFTCVGSVVSFWLVLGGRGLICGKSMMQNREEDNR